MTKTLTTLLLVAGVLTGCTLAPHYDRPAAPVAAGFPAAPEGYASAEVKSGEASAAVSRGRPRASINRSRATSTRWACR